MKVVTAPYKCDIVGALRPKKTSVTCDTHAINNPEAVNGFAFVELKTDLNDLCYFLSIDHWM